MATTATDAGRTTEDWEALTQVPTGQLRRCRKCKGEHKKKAMKSFRPNPPSVGDHGAVA